MAKLSANVVSKKRLPNGRFVYYFNDEIYRKSIKDYSYALLFLAKASMGACRDAVSPRVVGLGNNPQSLVNSWKSIYFYGNLDIVKVV